MELAIQLNEQDLRVIKTKKILFEKLLELLMKQDFDDITVTKLCSAAKVNRSTFYTHYSNIDELLEEFFRKIMSDLHKEYAKAFERLISKDKEGLVDIFEHILKHQSFYDVLFSNRLPFKYMTYFIETYMEFPKKIILKHIKEKIDYELYYSFCSSATMGLIYHWKNTGYAKSPLEMSVQTMKFFLREL